MSENNTESNDVQVATLQEGESVIPLPLVDKYNEAVKEQAAKLAGFTDGDIKISRPKEVRESSEDNVINSSGTAKKGGNKKSALSSVNNGALGSSKVEAINKEKKASVKPEVEKIALHSTKNVHWDGVGSLSKGYNIVRKDWADKWLSRNHVRLATPEEVAKGYSR